MACIRGVPLSGEKLGEQTFDGTSEVALFPGDLPADPHQLLLPGADTAQSAVQFIRFRPPRLARLPWVAGEPQPWPHVRLDRALQFLIGDRLS